MKPFAVSGSNARSPAGKVLVEALLILGAGLFFALAANRVSPRGLVLTRNYFPAGIVPPRPAVTNVAGTNIPALTPAQLLAARVQEQGFKLIDGSQAVQLFRDPRRQQGVILFVDARDAQRYQEGHIPGAWEFDPYHPEKYFPAVMPLCQAAAQIVVYCNGGDCDDSEAAALTLRDVGIATNKLYVYAGGFTEWVTNNLPVETGERDSGNWRNPKP